MNTNYRNKRDYYKAEMERLQVRVNQLESQLAKEMAEPIPEKREPVTYRFPLPGERTLEVTVPVFFEEMGEVQRERVFNWILTRVRHLINKAQYERMAAEVVAEHQGTGNA